MIRYKLFIGFPYEYIFFRLLYKIQFFLFAFFLFSGFTTSTTKQKLVLKTESAEPIEGLSKVLDDSASGGYSISLGKSGDGIKFTNMPAATKLVIRYTSLNVGTISVKINNKLAHMVNDHFSGALTNSFPNAVIDAAIPKKARLAVSLETDDVPVNIKQVTVGKGDLGLLSD